MKSLKYLYICLLLGALTCVGISQQNYELYVNGVLYRAPSMLEKGLPYFPVDVLSEATGVSVVSFSATSVRLTGSPVDFVPAVRDGRPYLPAEAFAMASGSGVETDQTRGIVMYTGNTRPRAATAPGAQPASATAGSFNPASTAPYYSNGMESPNGPAIANPGVTYDDPGPEAPVAAPQAAVYQSPSTEGMHEAVVDAMKSANEITYAQRWLKHKMYWANQLDPANSPYLRVTPPPVAPNPWNY